MNNYPNILMGETPHGGRSPVVSRQDSSGTLKTTISLGKTPTIIQTGPFYSMKEPPGKGELTGDKDLMTEYGLHHTLTKFKDKKVKESLASFLPNLPGIHETFGNMQNSTLRSIVAKPPIANKELTPLNSVQLAGFRLHPGPLPEQYRAVSTTPVRKHKNKHKKNKTKDGIAPQETQLGIDSAGLETYEKKHKKQKRHEDDKERKKRKKEKKRKKKSHSPDPQTNLSGSAGGNGLAGSLSSTLGLTQLPSTGPQMQQQQLFNQQMPLGSGGLQSQSHQLLHSSLSLGSGNSGSGLVGGSLSNSGSSLLGSTPGLSAVLGTNTGMSNSNVTGSLLGSNSTNSSGSNTGPGGLMMSQQMSLF